MFSYGFVGMVYALVSEDCTFTQVWQNDECVDPETDLPYEITITQALGSSLPGCEDTAEGCFISEYASIATGGKVIFSNTDTAVHTFTAGSVADGPSGAFNSNLVMAGSSYEWTPTTAGEVPYFCMLHPWMKGTILVEGMYIQPLNTDGDGISDSIDQCPTQAETVNGYQNDDGCPDTVPADEITLLISANKSFYNLRDMVTVKLSLSGVSSVQNIAISVTDPAGNNFVERSMTTDSDGNTELEFRIPESAKSGSYQLIATSSIDGIIYQESTLFTVGEKLSKLQSNQESQSVQVIRTPSSKMICVEYNLNGSCKSSMFQEDHERVTNEEYARNITISIISLIFIIGFIIIIVIRQTVIKKRKRGKQTTINNLPNFESLNNETTKNESLKQQENNDNEWKGI